MHENFPSNPLSLTYQTFRPLMARTGKLISGPCLLQKLGKIELKCFVSKKRLYYSLTGVESALVWKALPFVHLYGSLLGM